MDQLEKLDENRNYLALLIALTLGVALIVLIVRKVTQ